MRQMPRSAKCKKSAFAIVECQANTGLVSVGELYNIHLSRGDAPLPVPAVKGNYRNLGTDADLRVGNTETVERVVHRCIVSIYCLGGSRHLRPACLTRSFEASSPSIYGQSTPISWEDCKRIEVTRSGARCTLRWGIVIGLGLGCTYMPSRTKEALATRTPTHTTPGPLSSTRPDRSCPLWGARRARQSRSRSRREARICPLSSLPTPLDRHPLHWLHHHLSPLHY